MWPIWQNKIIQTGDYTQGTISGTFIRVFDPNGQVLSQKLIPNLKGIYTNATISTVNGNSCYVSGYYTDSIRLHAIYCIKLNQNIDSVWTRFYPEALFDPSDLRTSMTLMGTSVLSGSGVGLLLKSIRGKIENLDLLAKIDSNGNLKWKYNLNQYYSWIFNFLQYDQSKIVMAAADIVDQSTDLHVIVIDSSSLAIEKPISGVTDIALYPVPCHNMLYLENNNKDANRKTALITDLTGRDVLNAEIALDNSIDVTQLVPGFYLIRIFDHQGGYNIRKIIVEK